MFMKLIIALICLWSLSFISCASLSQVGAVSHSSDQSVVSSNDRSWSVAPLQTEDLRLLDKNRPKLWSGKPDLGVSPYLLTINESNLQASILETSEIVKVTGYRIQIFAGHEQDKAIEIKTTAESHLGISVYLVYEAPQYKVRAGNFVHRLQAMELLSHIKANGYRDAWIVRSQVDIEKKSVKNG